MEDCVELKRQEEDKMENEWKFLNLLFWSVVAAEICFPHTFDTHIDPNWHSRAEKECGLPYYDMIQGKHIDPDDELLKEYNSNSESSGDVNRNNDPDRSND